MKLPKAYYITACALLAGGLLLTGVATAAGAFNTEKFTAALNLKDRYFEVTEAFQSVSCAITENNMDIQFKKSDTDLCTITATNLPDNALHVFVKDDTLYIEDLEAGNMLQKLRNHVQFGAAASVPSTVLTVSLPDAIYDSVSIESEVGEIAVQSLKADSVSIEGDVGNIALEAMTIQDLSVENDTGEITMENVQVRNVLEVVSDAGDCSLKDCYVYGSGNIEGDCGEISMQNCTLVRTNIKTDTGDITLSACTLNNQCSISSDVGNVKCTLYAEENSCSVEATADVGEVWVNGKQSGYEVPNAVNALTIHTDVGDIWVQLEEMS
jgi:hypothetical protein